jgi:hypothetical protein
MSCSSSTLSFPLALAPVNAVLFPPAFPGMVRMIVRGWLVGGWMMDGAMENVHARVEVGKGKEWCDACTSHPNCHLESVDS